MAMNVVIAQEFSGRIRDAFLRRGHNALSVDLLPTESPGPHHQGDIFEFLETTPVNWDMMIAHPDCTYLCRSGRHWLFGGGGFRPDKIRWAKMEKAAAHFKRLLEWSRIPRRAIENPGMHEFATEIIGSAATQYVQPYWFGEKKIKKTGFHLINLPLLTWTDYVGPPPPNGTRWYAEWAEVHHASPGADRWKNRSRTYTGIANALAEQWG